MRKRTFVLLFLPNYTVRSDGFEFSEFRKEDAKVQVVAQVDPSDNKESEIGPNKRMIDVI